MDSTSAGLPPDPAVAPETEQTSAAGAQPVPLPPEPAAGRGAPRRPRRRTIAIAVLAIALAAAGAAGTISLSNDSGQPNPRGSAAAQSSTGSSTSTKPPPVLAPPLALTAKARAFQITLRWTPGTGDLSPTGYRIYRNGELVTSVLATTTSYVDDDVVPGKDYRYEVAARTPDTTSESASVSISTPVPALSSARVEGTFDVKGKVTSQSGFVGSLGDLSLGWSLEPKCKKGACDVVWKDLSMKDLTARLDRTKADYSGSDSGAFNARCGSAVSTSTLTIEITVKKARAIDGEWIATKLVGTLRTYTPASQGCVSSSANYDLTLKRLS